MDRIACCVVFILALGLRTAFGQTEREIADPAKAQEVIRELIRAQTETLAKIETWQGRMEFSRRVIGGRKVDSACVCDFKIDFKKGAKYCDYTKDLLHSSQKLLETPEANYSIVAGERVLKLHPAKAGGLIQGRWYTASNVDPAWLLIPERFSVSDFLADLTKKFPYERMIGKAGDIKSVGKLYQDGSKIRIHLGTSGGFAQDHVFDLAQGGLPISFTSNETKLTATAIHSYEKINGLWIPKAITYVETAPATGKARHDLDITFLETKVNEAIGAAAFDPQLNSMMAGVTAIQNLKTNKMEPVAGEKR